MKSRDVTDLSPQITGLGFSLKPSLPELWVWETSLKLRSQPLSDLFTRICIFPRSLASPRIHEPWSWNAQWASTSPPLHPRSDLAGVSESQAFACFPNSQGDQIDCPETACMTWEAICSCIYLFSNLAAQLKSPEALKTCPCPSFTSGTGFNWSEVLPGLMELNNLTKWLECAAKIENHWFRVTPN